MITHLEKLYHNHVVIAVIPKQKTIAEQMLQNDYLIPPSMKGIVKMTGNLSVGIKVGHQVIFQPAGSIHLKEENVYLVPERQVLVKLKGKNNDNEV